MRTALLFAAALLLASAPALAQQQTINFAWDPHPQAADLVGFELYQSRTTPVCPGNSAPTSAPVGTFSGGATTQGSIPLPSPGRYYWALVAATPGPDVIKSDCSNEVTMVVKPKPPKLLSAVQAALAAPVKAATAVASLFLPQKKGLRIEK